MATYIEGFYDSVIRDSFYETKTDGSSLIVRKSFYITNVGFLAPLFEVFYDITVSEGCLEMWLSHNPILLFFFYIIQIM